MGLALHEQFCTTKGSAARGAPLRPPRPTGRAASTVSLGGAAQSEGARHAEGGAPAGGGSAAALAQQHCPAHGSPFRHSVSAPSAASSPAYGGVGGGSGVGSGPIGPSSLGPMSISSISAMSRPGANLAARLEPTEARVGGGFRMGGGARVSAPARPGAKPPGRLVSSGGHWSPAAAQQPPHGHAGASSQHTVLTPPRGGGRG